MKPKSYTWTTVPVEQTMGQIRKILQAHGVEQTAFSPTKTMAVVEFIKDSLRYRIYAVILEPKSSSEKSLQAKERQLWRLLYWWLKAQLDAVAQKLLEFEVAFMPFIVIKDSSGRTFTFAETALPQIKKVLAAGKPLEESR